MGTKGRTEGTPGPGGGSPAPARRGGAGASADGGRGRARRRRGWRVHSPEERRALLEAWARSGMSAEMFAATVGLSPKTLYHWRRRVAKAGPKGLEPDRLGRPPGSGAGSRLPEPVKEAIVATKARFPTFGLEKVRQYLGRFLGLRVSARGVGRVLEEAAPVNAPPPRRRPPSRPALRRFERARPGQLWQTDITSYVLARHHRRVYLVAFVDDHSRYIVSWALAAQARNELVTGCLEDGIQRFGKPEEVLSDQGPQYYAWRGKSRFQKLLAKEGIKHAVARTHHPQTLGKCERLWKTIAEELWSRARPEDLEDARERLGHWVSFYNHFRPHQGIDGLVPADRFFGKETEVRAAIESRMAENELALALGKRPRKTLFVLGQVGDRQFALHGERGRVVLHTEEGVHAELGLEDLGLGREESDGAVAAETEEAAEGADPAGVPGEGAVAARDGGGAEEGARGGGGDPEPVARDGAEGGGERGARGDGSAPLADGTDGHRGDGSGTAQAAEEEGEGAAGGSRGGEPGGAEETHREAGAGPPGGPGAGGAAADAARVEEGWREPAPPWRSANGWEEYCEGA